MYMTYGSFLDGLEQALLRDKVDSERIRRVQILKNNGVKLDGFSCQVQGHREQPTVYVNHYYKEEPEQGEVEQIAKLILKIMRESILEPGEKLEQVLDFEKMKDCIYYRLISREQNEELLEQVPYIPWLDLAIVFYIRIPEHIVKNATALIRNSHLKQWGLTFQELYQTAIRNMTGVPVCFQPMEKMMEEYGYDDMKSGMYILSNESKEFGAAVIVNPKVQRMCANIFREGYYILPSSIHEVILLPRSMAPAGRELDEMVRGVNHCCVSQEEVLSDHAYYYSAESEKIYF
jgi:hypothetical protein